MGLKRLQKDDQCPMCERFGDGCMLSPDGAVALCVRTPSSDRRSTGYIHHLHQTWLSGNSSFSVPSPSIDYADEADEYHQIACANNYLPLLANHLSVTAEALERLYVGWCEEESAWTFPMTKGDGEFVSGILRRFPDGAKKLFPRHKAGVFCPAGLKHHETIVICEGATDTAAALSIGVNAIGRFSCRHGLWIIRDILDCYQTPNAVVLADVGNEHELQGANELADALSSDLPVKVATPPGGCKDFREYVAKRRGQSYSWNEI